MTYLPPDPRLWICILASTRLFVISCIASPQLRHASLVYQIDGHTMFYFVAATVARLAQLSLSLMMQDGGAQWMRLVDIRFC